MDFYILAGISIVMPILLGLYGHHIKNSDLQYTDTEMNQDPVKKQFVLNLTMQNKAFKNLNPGFNPSF